MLRLTSLRVIVYFTATALTVTTINCYKLFIFILKVNILLSLLPTIIISLIIYGVQSNFFVGRASFDALKQINFLRGNFFRIASKH